MTEEDKKAIEFNLKCVRNVMNNFEDTLCENMQKRVDEIKEYIEKQSKEIEELKVINNMQKYRIEVIDERELISKQKIEDTIQKMIKEKEWSLNNYDSDTSDYKQSQAIGSFVTLVNLKKQLLEE